MDHQRGLRRPADFKISLVVFVAVAAVVLWYMPKWTQYINVRLGATRVRLRSIRKRIQGGWR